MCFQRLSERAEGKSRPPESRWKVVPQSRTGGWETPITEFVMCSWNKQLPNVIGVGPQWATTNDPMTEFHVWLTANAAWWIAERLSPSTWRRSQAIDDTMLPRISSVKTTYQTILLSPVENPAPDSRSRIVLRTRYQRTYAYCRRRIRPRSSNCNLL